MQSLKQSLKIAESGWCATTLDELESKRKAKARLVAVRCTWLRDNGDSIAVGRFIMGLVDLSLDCGSFLKCTLRNIGDIKAWSSVCIHDATFAPHGQLRYRYRRLLRRSAAFGSFNVEMKR